MYIKIKIAGVFVAAGRGKCLAYCFSKHPMFKNTSSMIKK